MTVWRVEEKRESVCACVLLTVIAKLVPFEEDAKEPNIWFLDHNYHENMLAMFKKVTSECGAEGLRGGRGEVQD